MFNVTNRIQDYPTQSPDVNSAVNAFNKTIGVLIKRPSKNPEFNSNLNKYLIRRRDCYLRITKFLNAGTKAYQADLEDLWELVMTQDQKDAVGENNYNILRTCLFLMNLNEEIQPYIKQDAYLSRGQIQRLQENIPDTNNYTLLNVLELIQHLTLQDDLREILNNILADRIVIQILSGISAGPLDLYRDPSTLTADEAAQQGLVYNGYNYIPIIKLIEQFEISLADSIEIEAEPEITDIDAHAEQEVMLQIQDQIKALEQLDILELDYNSLLTLEELILNFIAQIESYEKIGYRVYAFRLEVQTIYLNTHNKRTAILAEMKRAEEYAKARVKVSRIINRYPEVTNDVVSSILANFVFQNESSKPLELPENISTFQDLLSYLYLEVFDRHIRESKSWDKYLDNIIFGILQVMKLNAVQPFEHDPTTVIDTSTSSENVTYKFLSPADNIRVNITKEVNDDGKYTVIFYKKGATSTYVAPKE